MLCWIGAGGAPVLAGEFAYGAGYSLARDSNLARVPTEPVAELTQVLYGGFAYQENTVNLNARVLAQAEARQFVRNTFNDGSSFYLDGSAVWTIWPRQFNWIVENIYREARVDLTAADTPANRTDTSTLSTGPDVTLRLDAANSLGLSARYGRFDIKGPGDNERYSGLARLVHQTSAATTLSLNYEATHAKFTPPALFAKVFREDLFARFETRASRTDNLTIEVGTSRAVPEGGEDLSGRLARLSAARQFTPDSAVRLSLADRLSDTFSELLGRTPTFAVPTATGDVYRSKSADLSYSMRGARIGYALQGYTRRTDYEHLDQDYEEQGGRLGLTWLYSGELRIEANTDYLRRTFLSFTRTDAERNHRMGATFFLTRNVSVVAEGIYTENESSEPLGSFVNRRVNFFLAYSTGPLYAPGPRR